MIDPRTRQRRAASALVVSGRHRQHRRRLGTVAAGLLIALTAACGDDNTASPGDDTPSDATPEHAASESTDPSGSVDEPAAEPVSIGVFVMAQAQLLDDIVAEFEATVTDSMAPVEVTFDEKNANGEQSLITSLARDFAGSEHDAFAVIGTPAVIALAQQVTDRPIFALAMGDPVDAGLADSRDAPGGNVPGSVDYIDPVQLIDQIISVHPDIESIGTVYEPSNPNLEVWVGDLRAATDEAGLALEEATVAGTGEVAQGSRSLIGRADTILIGPDATVIAGLDAVAATAVGEAVPLYVSGGDVTVDGVLGSIGPNYIELGTMAGDAAVRVLQGEDPGTVPFAEPSDVELQLNGSTVAQLGLEVPAAVTDTATIVE